MKNAIVISVIWLLTVRNGDARTTAPTGIDSPDRYFHAQVERETGRDQVVVQNNRSSKRAIIWQGTPTSLKNSVQFGKERVARMQWSTVRRPGQPHLLLLISELQRYRDVYDAHALYMFSAEARRLLWSKTFGRRWNESVDWSPRCDLIVTTTAPAGVDRNACVVMNSKTGREVKSIRVSELGARGFSKATGIESARFLSEDVIRVKLYQKDADTLAQYDWHFRE